MAKYIVKRVIMALITILVVACVTFVLMMSVPGSPFNDEKITPEQKAAMEAKYGMDDPLGVQMLRYLKGVIVDQDFGVSLKMQKDRPVLDIITEKFPLSAKIGVIALVWAVAVGIPLGCLAAYNRGLGLNPGDGRLSGSGTVHLTGKQALSYSRIRKIDSDFQRAGRQQKVLQAMLESAKQMNFFTMARLAWTCLREVRTDLTLGDLNALLPLAAGGGETNISMGRVPFDGAYEDATIDGMQVLRPNLERNRTLIRRFLSN